MNDVRQSHECKITNLPPAPKPTDAVPILKKDIVCLDGKGFLLYNVLSPNECQVFIIKLNFIINILFIIKLKNNSQIYF